MIRRTGASKLNYKIRGKKLKNLYFIVILILLSFNVYADSKWIFITESQDKSKIFIDGKSIKKSGDSITYIMKINFNKRDDRGTLSLKSEETINCRTKEYIIRYVYSFDDIDLNGVITSSFSGKEVSAKWTPITTGAIYLLLQALCK